MKRILVPPVPGVFSALGMLFPDVEHHYVRTFKRRLDALESRPSMQRSATLEAEGAAVLREEGFGAASHRFERLVDLRYVGANSELTVPLSVRRRARFCATPSTRRTSSNTATAPPRRRSRR